MTPRRLLLVALSILAMLPALACGGDSSGDSSDGTSATDDGDSGTLIMTRADGIYEYDIDARELRALVLPEMTGTFVQDPALSPDGTRLAYVLQPPPVIEDGLYDAGSDLWIADRDGQNARVLFQHIDQNQLVRFPLWEDDGHVLAVIQELERSDVGTNVLYVLQRIDISTGERTRLRDGVLTFDLTPDGQRIAYAAIEPAGTQRLDAAELEGGAPTTLLPSSANISPFNSVRFDPGGTRVAFAAADQAAVRVSPRMASNSVHALSTDAARLNGLPEDIWVIDAAGGSPQVIADVKEDVPALTWNGDGTHIYVLGSLALYDVDLRSGDVSEIGEGVYHGQLLWTP